MKPKLFVLAILTAVALVGCDTTDVQKVAQQATAPPDPKQQFLHFVPASHNNPGKADMEYIIDNLTGNLQDYHNRIPGMITYTTISDADQVYEITWTVPGQGNTYAFKFKLLEKANTIQADSPDAAVVMDQL